MTDKKSGAGATRVLGLFANEAELRDHIAQNLDLIEPQLELLKTEFPLDNPDGAGGRIDILARDRFDHLICIEVKRSDRSARDTLNELAKYIGLLINRNRVPREMIRCLVVSTHWHELQLPLSYFAASSGVDVVALDAVTEQGSVRLRPKPLQPLRLLPQLCPEMEVVWFDEISLRDRYLERLALRAASLPFVRLAALVLEPNAEISPGRSPYAVVICVWRVAVTDHDRIEAVIEEPVGANWPYFIEGWEAESDAMGWIAELPAEYAQRLGWSHGTAESFRNMLASFAVQRIERLGDWPRLEIINDDERIVRAALALSPLGGSERPNRHSYEVVVTPAVAPSWRRAVDGFLEFIDFEPTWRDRAETFLNHLEGPVSVRLYAFDKKHLFYAIHQAREHPPATLGFFEIMVSAEDVVLSGILGRYEWDGRTCPDDARSVIETIYCNSVWAVLSVGNAVDKNRYEEALPLHGFLPVVDEIASAEELEVRGLPPRPGLREFVNANPSYAQQVSEVLESYGRLPTDPTS